MVCFSVPSLKIACFAVILAAVSAYPGGAESYANQNIYGSNHDDGHHQEHYVSPPIDHYSINIE